MTVNSKKPVDPRKYRSRKLRRAAVLLSFTLLLTGCANSFNNENENTESERVIYAPNTGYDYGYYNMVSKKTSQKNPILMKDSYSDVSEIEFDADYIEDGRYISCDEYFENVYPDGTISSRYPNGNFLTNSDGERIKLCPDPVCRKNNDEYCSHVNLMGGFVDGNYVYYIGKYKNPNKKKNVTERTFTSLDYSCYFMRYNIPENNEEVITELPYWSGIAYSAFGCIYINVDELANAAETVNVRAQRTLIYDKKQNILAETNFRNPWKLYGAVAFGSTKNDKIYLANNKIYLANEPVRYYPGTGLYGMGSIETVNADLTDLKVISEPDYETFQYAGIIGTARNRVYYLKMYLWDSDRVEVISLDENGTLREVIGGEGGERILSALVFDGYLYTVSGGVVTKYFLNRVGKIESEGEVVFRESDSCYSNERAARLFEKGGGIMLKTEYAGDDTGATVRIFTINDDGAYPISYGAATAAAEE